MGMPGRLEGVGLTDEGKAQADKVACWLMREGVQHVYSSPQQRALETAQPLAADLDCDVEVAEDACEFHFGIWEGALFENLKDDAEWKRFNDNRVEVRAPGGETMLEVQERMARLIGRLCQEHEGERVALIGHNDPIKAAIAHFLDMAPSSFYKLTVDPASVTCLSFGTWGPQLLFSNLRVY